MPKSGTKRERILDWIRNGDPDKVPAMISPGFYLAAAYLGKEPKDVTWAEAASLAEETGTHNFADIYSPSPVDAAPFTDDLELVDDWDKLPDGTPRLTSRIKTPGGELRSVQEFPRNTGAYHREFFVKDENDLPVFADFIRRTSRAIVDNPAVRARVDKQIKEGMAVVKGAFPTCLWVFCPAVELTSSGYMDQATAIYTIYDRQDLMEELMDLHWQGTRIWLDLAAANKIDIIGYAINGYEWLSPDLYQRYMVPQALRINEFTASHKMLSWLHTCGKMARIAESRMYQRMKINILESLSSKPTGDIDDLARTRADIGPEIVTRGGINVEYFYGKDKEKVARQAELVLEATRGYKHMLGDTNGSYPVYPRENIEAMIQAIRKQGRLYE